jgi:hypothetical protein
VVYHIMFGSVHTCCVHTQIVGMHTVHMYTTVASLLCA